MSTFFKTRARYFRMNRIDAVLEQVGRLRGIEYLNLAGSHVSDAGLAHLARLTALRWLSLTYTDVTDAGLVHLRGALRLENLLLDLTRVGDAGLSHLDGLTGLKGLLLPLSASYRAAEHLRRAHPSIRIVLTGGTGGAQGRALDLQEKRAKGQPGSPPPSSASGD